MKYTTFFLALILALSTLGCSSTNQKYHKEYLLYLDTYSTLTVYSTKEEFEIYQKAMDDDLAYYDKLFNIYDSAEFNNLKTVNDNAGVKPIKVDDKLIKLISISKDSYTNTNEFLNVSMGSVLKIWHEHRQMATSEQNNATLPTMAQLQEANKYTNIEDIIIDTDKNTVYITNPNTSIDVGAIAKGYTADLIADNLKSLGLESGLINLGGNVIAIGTPEDKPNWQIGLQNPDGNEGSVRDILSINNISVVTSGNYQRYYIVGDKKYHHIIDPNTLLPADDFKAVTVIHPSSTTADMLSTALFIMPYADGLELAKKYNAEAVWTTLDDEIFTTDNYNQYLNKD